MHEQKCESYISPKDLMMSVLLNWRKVLLIAIVFTIICGSYKLISGMRILSEQSNSLNQSTEYQTALSNYEKNKKVLETDINKLTSSVQRQEDYNENSVIMQIDPYNETRAIKNIYINTDYKIMPGMTYQNVDVTKSIISAYVNLAANSDIYSYILDHLSYDIDIRYLKEIIFITPDYDANMIKIQVIYFNKDKCKEILDLITAYFDQIKDTIATTVGVYEISSINETVLPFIDLELDNTQKNNLLTLANYENALNEKRTALEALAAPLASVVSKDMVIKSIIKYAIIGFILGTLIVIAFLTLSFLMSDKLVNENSLRSHYNIKTLGNIDKNKKKRIFGNVDCLIQRLGGSRNILLNESESLKLISSNIKAMCKINQINNGIIMLTGTIKPDRLQIIREKIAKMLGDTSYQLLSCANISYCAETVEQIMLCNAVVIVEETGESTYTEISKQLDSINSFEKNILGAILV